MIPYSSPLKSLALAFTLCLLAFQLAPNATAAVTIVSDDFNTLVNSGSRNASGQYSTGGSVWWYQSTNGLATSAVSSPTATGNFSGNWIQTNYANGSGPNNAAISTFSGVTLANTGDWLSVQFDFRYTSGFATDRNPQFGLFGGTAPTADSTGTNTGSGYGVNVINTTAGSDQVAGYKVSGADFFSATSVGAAASAGSTFDGLYTANFQMVVTRTGASSVLLELFANGNSTAILSVTDSSATNFTYNEFALRARGTGQIDNFTVITSVPEPGTVFLFIFGLAAMALLLRRKGLALRRG